ncbi:MAG: oligosaccharide flippase family protein [Clostridia bacterium]|nr:oligosaccharide flippase family protein [Clostridia bacterium]
MNKTAKAFSIVTGFSILTRAIGFLFKIWMSRKLGAEIVGAYHIAQSVIFMLFTLTAGAPTVLSRKVAEAIAKGDTKRGNSLACASVIIGLVTALLLVVLFVALKDRLNLIFSNPDCIPIFLILLPTLVTSTIYASLRSWFWGRKNFIAFSSTELVDEVTKLILSVVFAGGFIATLSPSNGIALAVTISDCLCCIILAALFFANGGRLAKPQGFKELLTSMIPLSATRVLSSIAVSLIALLIPKLLTATGLTTAQATAEYGRVAGMALPLIMAPVTLIFSLSIVLIPDVAGLKAQSKIEELKGKLSTVTLFALLVAAMFFALYFPLGEQLGILLFKDSEAGRYVSYCSAMLFPIALAQATTPMLNSLGKERATLASTIAGGVVMLPIVFFLTKVVGTYAMALASGTCFLIMAIVNAIILHREIGGFADVKKCAVLVALTIPLAATGYFCNRLLRPIAGDVVSLVVTTVYTFFFAFLLVNAFGIVDVVGVLRLMRPAKISSKPYGRRRRVSNRQNRRKISRANQKT